MSPKLKRSLAHSQASSFLEPSHSSESPASGTPTVRMFRLLKAIARLSCHFSLQDMVEATGLPKPIVRRMLHQLEEINIMQRDANGQRFILGNHIRTLANQLLINDSLHGARQTRLRHLREVGESYNLTALIDGQVLYLDRVETRAPLLFYLHPGSRVPMHASATKKLF